MSPEQIEADREVSEIERAAATQWRLSPSDGTREQYVERDLRAALVDARAELVELQGENELADVEEEIDSARDSIRSLADDYEIGDAFADEIARASDDREPSKWPDRVWDLVKALAECVAARGKQIEQMREDKADLQAGVEPGAHAATVKRVAASKRVRVGATTMALPFLVEEKAENDVAPATVAVVVAESKPAGKRGRKAAA